jgi:hypothetical protein
MINPRQPPFPNPVGFMIFALFVVISSINKNKNKK